MVVRTGGGEVFAERTPGGFWGRDGPRGKLKTKPLARLSGAPGADLRFWAFHGHVASERIRELVRGNLAERTPEH